MGVNRQLEDCEQLAVLRGWAVAETYVDDDVSAYSGKTRPEYARMLDDLRTGMINGVLVYHLDRLHRQPKELEEFFEVCKDAGVDDLATVTGRIDLGDPCAVSGPYPRCGGQEGERRQEPPHSSQA